MEYVIDFNFTVAKKNSRFVGKSGTIEVTTDATPEQMKDDEDLKKLIAREMNGKVKGALGILIVDIIKVTPKFKPQ